MASPGVTRVKDEEILDALVTLNERSGSTISSIRGYLKQHHPDVPCHHLPLVLKRLASEKKLEETPTKTYKATSALAGKAGKYATAVPEQLQSYFVRLCQIVDDQRQGVIAPTEFYQLLKLSGFRFTAIQLATISATVQVNHEGLIPYPLYVPTMVEILRKEQAEEEKQAPTDEAWDLFSSAMENLSLGASGAEAPQPEAEMWAASDGEEV